MTISSTALPPLSSVTATAAITSVSASPSTDRTSPSAEPTESSKTRLSKLGEMMSKLQDLETSDPAKAKQVLTSIAATLNDKANSASDPRLKALADKFTSAAETGDLSSLQPSGPPPGARAHHPGHAHGAPPAAAEDASASSAASATDASGIAKYAQTNHTPRVDLASIVSDALASAAT
jgi:hypothetical protein